MLTTQRAREVVDDDIVQYVQPPKWYANSHRHMYAYGMHLRVHSSEGGLVTRDSCVVALLRSQPRWGI